MSGETSFAFHHVGIVTQQFEQSIALYEQLGAVLTGDFQDPIQKARIGLMKAEASPLVEIICPESDDSPAAGWVRRIQAGPYHTCYEVPDIHVCIARFRKSGFWLLSEPVPAVAFAMRQVAFLWSPTIGLLELLEGSE